MYAMQGRHCLAAGIQHSKYDRRNDRAQQRCSYDDCNCRQPKNAIMLIMSSSGKAWCVGVPSLLRPGRGASATDQGAWCMPAAGNNDVPWPWPWLLFLPFSLAAAPKTPDSITEVAPLVPSSILLNPMAWVLGPVCRGSLLHAVQMQRCFEDSKHFVDMPLKPGRTVEALMAAFQALPRELHNSGDELPSKANLLQLLDDFFMEPGGDLVKVMPPGMTDTGPSFIKALHSPEVEAFARSLYKLWPQLYRKCHEDVAADPSRFTLLSLPNPFMIAGDRFRECYYWDSYWILRGLIACGMGQAARDMVINMLDLTERWHQMPNGTRCYYTNRSQPPLLSAMVMLVSGLHSHGPSNGLANQQIRLKTWDADALQNIDLPLLQRAHGVLMRVYADWRGGEPSSTAAGAGGADGGRGGGGVRRSGKAVNVSKPGVPGTYTMTRYRADWQKPRPESYREDWQLAAAKFDLSTCETGAPPADAQDMWCELASGAESGWDFSSRWMTDPQDLATIRCTQIIPADLNAFVGMMADDISAISHVLGHDTTCAEYQAESAQIFNAMNDLMWSEESNMWCDLLLVQPDNPNPSLSSTGQTDTSGPVQHTECDTSLPVMHVEQLQGVYASNWVPLWVGAACGRQDRATAAVEGLWESGLVRDAGLMTSLVQSGQQWDAPNCWPPLLHMAVEGMQHSGAPGCVDKAAQLAGRWLYSAYLGYQQTGHMFEKYNAERHGVTGGGGEYKPQVGFGWTNGVVLDLLYHGYQIPIPLPSEKAT